ncbi:ABC transporter permease [Solirubrobacter ginsenosidimutans]|uniref:ABC transporter permease n=1 Tax=Solirubrobacter ginsenosidimutans TaxID=490573 RepID=A0A9X3MRG5_9ACTN|nr:FtsX-like permease family protein [Solirubrobacter ginsenosidimutans]MDA0160447.1 ABC transporter permease [Solirubrobacter ginsenosidimutans]
MRRYVWRELVRNPRRTLASLVGVTLGIALFSAVLFFADGSRATMTRRALAPLALDLQRVRSAPLGAGPRLRQRVVASPSGLAEGETATIALTVSNRDPVAANEVVVNDEPPPRLTYVHASTRLNGRPLRDKAGQSPLAQGLARTGLNLGTIGPGETVRLTYRARAARAVRAPAALPVRGTISTRENVVPTRANAPSPVALERLRRAIAALPGVASADALSFADLPPGSVGAGRMRIRDPVRVFAFGAAYARHYPSIRIVEGAIAPGAALLSAEAARGLALGTGGRFSLRLPGRRLRLSLPVSGIADLARAKPLFYSRRTARLEDFIYVPHSVVVSPETFRRVIVPAFREGSAKIGRQLKSLPVSEVDVRVDRSRLETDPGRALVRSHAIAQSVGAVAPGQDYLIDNLSNTLAVAKADSAVATRMFLFLGLPGVLLAAFLAAYAGSILAGAQRREHANLRMRGAHRGHLRTLLVHRTLAIAGVGTALGVALGVFSAAAVVGPDALRATAVGDLARSALIAGVIGMATTALALYVPGRRALRREISQERAELAPHARGRPRALAGPAVMAAAIVALLAWRAAAFDPPSTSVSAGESVVVPSYLLLAPLTAWFAGMALAVRASVGLLARLRLPAAPHFGSPVPGTLVRSLRRRSRSLGTGIAGVGLVVAFGAALAVFSSTYDRAKAADARFVVGADLRVVPSALSPRSHPPAYAAKLRVPGVEEVTAVVSRLDNAVLIGPNDQDRATLTAIEPSRFARVTGAAVAPLEGRGRAALVNVDAADALAIDPGEDVKVLLARGTKRQTLETFRVAGLFERLPGFPRGTDAVINLRDYAAATHLSEVDSFLVRAADGSDEGLARTEAVLRSGPGKKDPIDVETRAAALDKDQSSLTALNVGGLVQLDSVYTLLICAVVVAIFVFGLLLDRRREYVALRAQGMRTGEVRALVLGEAAVVVGLGMVAGLLVGAGMAVLLVGVLRPLFILDPTLGFPMTDIVTLAALAGAATLASALAATALLRRLKPTELLREA